VHNSASLAVICTFEFCERSKPYHMHAKEAPPQQPAFSYCEFVSQLPPDNLHCLHHDHVHGYAVTDDNELFARLVMEINQAGLSWFTILKKEKNFREAFHQFDVARVASYDDNDRERLMNDAGIIRNRLKIDAAIHNAKVIMGMKKDFGSFKAWLDDQHPKNREEWTKLFRKTFKFTGGEIVNEFLMSTGYLPGAHIPSCPVYQKVLTTNPMFNV
jgi:DNA-3-methyladenine glycosylase I